MTETPDDMVVYELPPSMFERAEPLFREMWFDVAFVGAVFEGRHRGRLFADDAERPTAAMLTNQFEYYVAGTSDSNSLRTFIREAPAEAEIFEHLFGYAPLTIEWTLALLADHDEGLVVVPRRAFRWSPTVESQNALRKWRDVQPGVEVREINAGLALRIEEEIHEYVGHFWGGREVFLDESFGFCTIVDGRLASIAYAIAIGRGEANIAIFTVPDRRRQGHAMRAATAYVDRCTQLGLVPTWDCDSDNPRSADLARKLGFREVPPFSQLSPPRGMRIELSHGLWTRRADEQGIAIWQRTNVGR